MNLKEKLITVRDDYVKNQAANAKLPEFEESRILRYRIQFSGRVQHVGFRLELSELAKRLDLHGFAENMENGDVIAELQGEEMRIQYLIHFMDHLKRIKIKNMKIEEIACVDDEIGAGGKSHF